MKKQALTVAMMVSAALGWTSTAAAQGPGGPHMRQPGGPGFGPGGPGGPPIEMLAERLGLSDEQKTQWKAIHDSARETGEPLMKAAGEAKEAFDKALEAENPDANEVGQAAILMKAARLKIEAQRKATFDAAKAILTPEQLAKVEQMEKHRAQNGALGPQGPGMRRPRGPRGSK